MRHDPSSWTVFGGQACLRPAMGWGWFVRLFLACLLWVLSAAASAYAAQPASDEELPFEAQIQRCWSTPTGADTPATIAFKLKPDGSLDGDAVIKSRGEGPLNEAFAQSALRAVRRCSPYEVDGELEFETTFHPDPTRVLPDANAKRLRGEQAAKDFEKDDPRVRVFDFGPVKVGMRVPEGFCAIDPKRGGYHEKVWKSLTPPPKRAAELQSLDIDCESLKTSEAGRETRPKHVFSVMRFYSGKEPLPENLASYLDLLQKRYEKRVPLTPRFWQDPPVEGTPFFGRDKRAVYLGQRALRERGKIAVSGVSAYTMVEKMPMLINYFAADGSDLAAERQSAIAGIIADMRVVWAD
ncbi:Hypothetical protein NGAL_HAMBI1189_15040 [Neorhizobium galegae bv. officinalis]|uniref:TonB family protein n=2 Tax=Neorhizobium galegae TaxID=399 RepID=A0A0T7GHD5_NEOGA|nr:Hypothetical protein NGAL_HAMBI1189_15040 [Neorhizobium galegae bv. officinalis]